MQTYVAAHTHTHSFPHTCSPMGSGSADTKRLSPRVKGHPGRGQIRTLGFFSVGQADIPSHTHTHTHSVPLLFFCCSVGQQGRGGQLPEPALKSRIILHSSHKRSRSSRAPNHLTTDKPSAAAPWFVFAVYSLCFHSALKTAGQFNELLPLCLFC